MIRLTSEDTKEAIRALLTDDRNHRAALFEIINREFLQYTLDTFADIARAKIQKEDLFGGDWYRNALKDPELPKEELAVKAGLPIKTIENIHGSTRREVVLEASLQNYDHLLETIEDLIALKQPELVLTMKFAGVGIDWTVTESLIVINALAVKREQIRAGYWSALGNAVERPLMRTLCELHHVPRQHWRDAEKNEFPHQIDFVLMNHGHQYLVEVKLSGKGNPESAKAAHAHNASLLVGDRLSDQAKNALTKNRVEWVELAASNGYQRFGHVLMQFSIPHEQRDSLDGLDEIIDRVIEESS